MKQRSEIVEYVMRGAAPHLQLD